MPCRTELLHLGSEASKKTYLNTAAEGLLLKDSALAVERYLADKASGEPGRVALFQTHENTRELAGKLFGVEKSQVALMSSTTEVLNNIAQGITWKPGDEVIFTSTEFPSNMFPWVSLAEKGLVTTKVVKPRDGLIRVEDILEQINEKTRLVTVSQVSYATGQNFDPTPIWEKVRDTNTLLCVDATQAVGRVPVHGDRADFVVSSCFKWLNSLHGSAIYTTSPRVITEGVTGPSGWFSTENCYTDDRLEAFHPLNDARRFHSGMPNFDSVYSLEASLKFHRPEVVAARKDELEPLVAKLHAGLTELDFPVLTPASPEERAGIVAFNYADSAVAKQKLAERNIFVHGDDGRVRATAHWYNTAEDIDRFLETVKELL